ncbi:MAG: hypothetical protein HC817_07320 [Saprospiraceae bacterium]|nr:hypothetical protein [Saprospiraceae bacterium]
MLKTTSSSGKELANIYCANCHLLPNPLHLDKKTWANSVLPEMAFFLGMRPVVEKLSELPTEDISIVTAHNLYPSKPLLSHEDWKKIVDFYVSNAPDSLPLINNGKK